MQEHQTTQNQQFQLTQSEALELYPKTGILILLNLPKKIRLGIDNLSYEIGSKFKGFKLIPEGVHYVHWATQAEKYMFVEGMFLWFSPGEVSFVVKICWDFC